MADAVTSFVEDPASRTQFASTLRRVAHQASPRVLVRGIAGTNQSAWATALLLTVLAVPRETVFADYLSTGQYGRAQIDAIVASYAGSLPDPEWVRPFFEPHREYLQAGFNAITDRYGTLAAFFSKGLDLDHTTVDQLRRKLLE
jgi:protein-tyrosine phosphatase